MAKTVLFSHPVCADHDPGARHPESGARLRAIEDALAAEAFADLERREAPVGEPESLAWAHDKQLVDAISPTCPTRDGLRSTPTRSCRRPPVRRRGARQAR